MEPHVERIATASEQALRVLGDQDRVAIMVFDTRTRVRLPFRNNQSDVTHEFNRLLRSEGFNGGTRITSAMVSAARYVEKEARPEARRAIVILTDDMTQDGADEGRVETALRNAGATMSFLQAPYEEQSMPGGRMPGSGRRRGPWGSSGGGWPGGGGGWPGGGGGGGPLVFRVAGAAPEQDQGEIIRIRQEPRPLPKTQAVIRSRCMTPPHCKIRWNGCGNVMRCSFICRKA